MRIPIVLFTNLIWLIGISKSRSTPAKIAWNQAKNGDNVDHYITIDISSTPPVDNYYFLNCQINGVNSVIFFPNSQKKVQQVSNGTILLWNKEQNEEFIIGFISKQPGSQDHLIHLMINTQTEIMKLYYNYVNGEYSSINIFTYLDMFSALKPTGDRTQFTLDLSKDDIPEILDKGAILGRNRASLMIPKAAYKANKVIYGPLNVYDGSAIQTEIPIAIIYRIQGASYLDLMLVKEGQNIGYIHSYQFISEGDTRLVSSSGPVPIFDIFVARVNAKDINKPAVHPRVREIRRESSNENDIMEVNLDITNIDRSVIRADEYKVLNIKTIKYSPVGVIITSVSYGKKELWRSNEDEIRCTNVITHSVSNIMQSIEIAILDNTGMLSAKIIPLQTITEESETGKTGNGPNLVVKDGKWEFEEPSDFENNGVRQNTYIGTPPNSPARMAPNSSDEYIPPEDYEFASLISKAPDSIYVDDSKSTPPNSPARSILNTPEVTPPPSPMASPRSSLYPGKYTVNGYQDGGIYYNIYSDYSYDDTTIGYPYDIDEYSNYSENYSEDAESVDDIELVDDRMFDMDYVDAMHQQDFYDDEYGKKYYYSHYKQSISNVDDNLTLDVSSEESISKLYIIDGRKYAPFIFLMPHLNQKIHAVVDGSQMIWDGTELGQLLKYVTLYVVKEEVRGMYLMITHDYAIVNKYYFKKGDKWIEITFEEYMKKTNYKTKEDKDQKKPDQKDGNKEDKSNERELHVSIMFPVIIGSLFLIVSVCSLLFILFFC
ncbi:hypothetical protein MACJ_002340 [Theileria orientalis]|uniref:Uncharacterized protein n=1 Tax=Theileria orientalis TaxID=68886 RepID=A0A976M5Z5_THEOR|nr:hypothetical protein MACJ_002340 [Theileria orientalis]